MRQSPRWGLFLYARIESPVVQQALLAFGRKLVDIAVLFGIAFQDELIGLGGVIKGDRVVDIPQDCKLFFGKHGFLHFPDNDGGGGLFLRRFAAAGAFDEQKNESAYEQSGGHIGQNGRKELHDHHAEADGDKQTKGGERPHSQAPIIAASRSENPATVSDVSRTRSTVKALLA
jgi:hypothetical protein